MHAFAANEGVQTTITEPPPLSHKLDEPDSQLLVRRLDLSLVVQPVRDNPTSWQARRSEIAVSSRSITLTA